MSIGTAIEAAVRAHVGELQPALVSDDEVSISSYEEAREVLGSNVEIAEAAGYGAPGQYRRGSPEWTRRQTFMRGLQRAEQRRTGGPGQSRSGAKIAPRVVTVARIEATRQNTPTTTGDVIRLMGMRGTTSTAFEARVQVSSDTRDRSITMPVYVHRENFARVGWNMHGRVPRTDEEWAALGIDYGQAFLIAYGIPEGSVVPGDVDPIFLFTLGRDEEGDIDYEYT